MSKVSKRKTLPAATEEATTRRTKRVKASPPPQYVEEQRNLQDLWKAAFLVGTKWDRLDSVYKYNWDFRNLEKEFEEGGKFYGIGPTNKVYIFAATETASTALPELLPTLATVVAPRPPSMEIAINAVQREEEIVPLKHMKMDWMPYIPLAKSNLPQIFVMDVEEEKERDADVEFFFPREPQPPLNCEFNWEVDEVETYTDNLIEEEELSPDEKEEFMEILKEEVKKSKRKMMDARKKRMENPNYEEAATYYGNMKLYKIYPVQTPDTPMIENRCHYVNRYYRPTL
ncbi:hypothetical protein ACLB2K_064339 [Fragaria x ananassa]